MLEYSDFETLSHLSVCEIDEHSDHCALFFRLKLSHSNTFTVDNSRQNNINNPLKKLVWTCENEDQFLGGMGKYNNLFTSLDNNSSSIDDVVEIFLLYFLTMHSSILVKRHVPRFEQPDILGLTLGLIIHVKLKNKISIVRNMSTADVVQI